MEHLKDLDTEEKMAVMIQLACDLYGAKIKREHPNQATKNIKNKIMKSKCPMKLKVELAKCVEDVNLIATEAIEFSENSTKMVDQANERLIEMMQKKINMLEREIDLLKITLNFDEYHGLTKLDN